MRLSELQVEKIVTIILKNLKLKKLIQFKTNELDVHRMLKEIFIKELRVEDDLDREAERLLEAYVHKLGGNIDRKQALRMIKKKLAEEKGVVL